jgi:hypothetical protein
MKNRSFKVLTWFFVIVLLFTFACNAPFLAGAPTSSQISTLTSQNAIPATVNGNNPSTPVPESSSTPPPVNHVAIPADTVPIGNDIYDVDSSGTAPENRAPYGDSYNINLFERPFTQMTMTYIPALDIETFNLSQDTTWYYVTLRVSGGDVNDPIGINYGVELDTNHDGIGDYLIWANGPYKTTWTTDTVRVYSDPNNDVGGASPEKSDANATTSAPYPGDGYETIVFDKGRGTDPDMAWVRIDPNDATTIQFAFKRSLAGNVFMWGVWADGGLKDPSKFNYNDRFTLKQAGSPLKSSPDYPIKAIYQVDNSCWPAYGFSPTGYEPHLCPSNAPPSTKKAHTPQATSVPTIGIIKIICLPAGTLIDTPSGSIPVEKLLIGDPVWSVNAAGERVSVTILKVSSVAVPAGHPLINVTLADGRKIAASPGHPTTDGRTFGEIRTGDYLDGARVTQVNVLPSNQPATFDLLPSGPTGFYWANGVLIGSTLKTP